MQCLVLSSTFRHLGVVKQSRADDIIGSKIESSSKSRITSQKNQALPLCMVHLPMIEMM